ncbi:MAG: hypothetical protein WC095_01775 [Candidatus Paceibacterota bacterium]
MEIKTAQEFAEAIRRYASSNGLTIAGLARSIGKPRETVQFWANGKLKNEESRQKIMNDYPMIFSEDNNFTSTSDTEGIPFSVIMPVSNQHKPAVNRKDDVQVLMRIELGRHGIVALSDTLQWFIAASPTERDKFRESLGGLWRNFLDLTRAMTGERALEIALEERRVTNVYNNH